MIDLLLKPSLVAASLILYVQRLKGSMSMRWQSGRIQEPRQGLRNILDIASHSPMERSYVDF